MRIQLTLLDAQRIADREHRPILAGCKRSDAWVGTRHSTHSRRMEVLGSELSEATQQLWRPRNVAYGSICNIV